MTGDNEIIAVEVEILSTFEVMMAALLIFVSGGKLGNVEVNVRSAFKIPGGVQGPGTKKDKIDDRGTEAVGVAVISKEMAELVRLKMTSCFWGTGIDFS